MRRDKIVPVRCKNCDKLIAPHPLVKGRANFKFVSVMKSPGILPVEVSGRDGPEGSLRNVKFSVCKIFIFA